MNKISVVLITLNEELNLDRCLESVREIADEIVVVDSYSTDRTKEIALKHNARFIEHPFDGYIEQRNWAAEQAENDLILAMDADEELSPELVKSIHKVKHSKKTADGYYFNRLNNYCGKWIRHTLWYPDKKLRLYNRKLGRSTGTNPHDRIMIEKGGKTKYLHGDLKHYSFPTMKSHINQVINFAIIAAKAKHRQGTKVTFLDIFFRPYWTFFKSYIIKLGILDGYYGFIISTMSAYGTFLKYSLLRQINLGKENF